MVEYHLISAKDIVATASARQESLTRNITRAESGKGTSWSQTLEQMDGLSAKEVLTSMKGDNFIFPIEDGTVKLSGGDQDLRTSTIIQDSPDRGEEEDNLRGESEGSSSTS